MAEFKLLKVDDKVLRLAKPDEASKVLQYFLDNKARLTPFEPKKPEGFYTIPYWEDRLIKNIEEFDNDKSLRLFLFDEESSVIGSINFTEIVRGPFQACYLGFSIDEKAQGKGMMSKALTVAIEHVFTELGLHRIMANHLPDNERSARLLERLGFVKEGYAKEYLFINGVWQDHVLTSLTRQD